MIEETINWICTYSFKQEEWQIEPFDCTVSDSMKEQIEYLEELQERLRYAFKIPKKLLEDGKQHGISHDCREVEFNRSMERYKNYFNIWYKI